MHWLIFLIFVVIYAAIEFKDWWPKGSDMRSNLMRAHESFGLLVLALVWLRIAFRIKYPAPPIEAEGKALLAAKGMYLVLYVLMIALPMVGWLMLSANDKPIPFFTFQLPALIAPDPSLGKLFRGLHGLLGNLSYFLIGGHILMAFYHHFKLKDNTLLSMLPERK